MVHLRLNDPDTSRNPHINYITSLPCYSDHEEARRRLLQIAAIFRPIMKTHGLQINSLEEYEPNAEFSGRNWNAGETIELVLRTRGTKKGAGGGGGFVPFPLLCYVMSHELAHSFEMNHSSRHAAWTKQFSQECRELQQKGYYGDGMWSAGRRLNDSEWCQGSSTLSSAAVPLSLCGGAWKKGRGGVGGRKRKRTRTDGTAVPTTRRKKGIPSLHTGAQTTRNTEMTAGKGRAYVALPGQGTRVDGRDYIPKASAKSKDYKLDDNSTFRKRANTSAARDLRAAATLRRINALQAGTKEEEEEEKGRKEDQKREAVDRSSETKKGSVSGSLRLISPALGGQSESDGEEPNQVLNLYGEDYVGDGPSETEEEQDDEGGLYESATDEEAYDWPVACGATSDRKPGEVFSSAAAGVSTSPATIPRETMSTTENDAQRQDRMERYRQSLTIGVGSRQDAEAEEEWQTAIKDVQRMGSNQRRLDALQRVSRSTDSCSGSTGTTAAAEAKVKSELNVVRDPQSALGSSTTSSRLGSLLGSTKKRASSKPIRAKGHTLRIGRGGGDVGNGISRLLSLQPSSSVIVGASAAGHSGTQGESESEDDFLCTGFKKGRQ